MLVNFWSSAEFRSRFEISFSYRHTRKYWDGLSARVAVDFPVHRLHFPQPAEVLLLSASWPRIAGRLAQLVSRLVFTLPLLAYEIWILTRLLRRLDPDILHINNGGYPAALSARAAAIAAKLTGTPAVMVVNNLATDYRSPLHWLQYPLDRLVARSVDMFVTGSVAAANTLRLVLRLNEAKSVAINNGVRLRHATETVEQTRTRLGLDAFDGIVFGVIAVMEPRKGHIVLLQALAELVRTDADAASRIKVVIEGDGPLRRELEQFVVRHGIAGQCSFTGSEQNIMNLLAALDVLVLPSIGYEDFPNVVLEAMACGKMVIASRLAGTPEQVIEAETGFLVPPGDSQALAARMALLCRDRHLIAELGRKGRVRFEQSFAVDLAVRKYMVLHNSLIEERNK